MSIEAYALEERFSQELPHVESIGLMMFDPVWAEKMHPSRYCEILHVVSGCMDLVMPTRRYHAGPGETLLVPPNTPHRDEFKIAEGLEVFYCSFSWACADDFFNIVAAAPPRKPSPVRQAELSTLFDQLRADPAGPGQLDRVITRSRLLTILLLLLRESMPANNTQEASFGEQRAQRLMLDAKTYIQKHYSDPILLDDIASALHVSSYHLSHVFSQESDFSLFAYLTTVRMEKAKTLLLEETLNVSEIALAVGYQNPNYFSKAFRKHVGCSPREFITTSRGT